MMKRKLTKAQRERMAARDKRKTAAHEAGHAVVGASLGVFGQAWLTANDDGAAWWAEAFWGGTYSRPPRYVVERLEDGTPEVQAVRPQAVSEHGEAMIGAAGLVAEHIVRAREAGREAGPEDVADAIRTQMAVSGMEIFSPTDYLPLASRGDLPAVLAEAAGVILAQRPLHDRLTAELLEDEYLSDGQVEQLCRELWHGLPPAAWPPAVDLDQYARRQAG